MPKNLLDQAQIVVDDFYQQFQPEGSFFGLEDVAIRLRDQRDSELEREFLVQYNLNKNTFPIISPFWTKNVFVDVQYEKDTNVAFAEICDPLYEFPFDEIGSSIQEVSPAKQGCSQFVRIAFNQIYSLCLTPSTPMIFFSLQGCRITLHNFFGCTDKLMVTIVPSQSGLPLEQQTLPDGKAATIREVVLNKMFRDYQVKLGKISVHGESQNPNPALNETPTLYENLKTK